MLCTQIRFVDSFSPLLRILSKAAAGRTSDERRTRAGFTVYLNNLSLLWNFIFFAVLPLQSKSSTWESRVLPMEATSGQIARIEYADFGIIFKEPLTQPSQDATCHQNSTKVLVMPKKLPTYPSTLSTSATKRAAGKQHMTGGKERNMTGDSNNTSWPIETIRSTKTIDVNGLVAPSSTHHREAQEKMVKRSSKRQEKDW